MRSQSHLSPDVCSFKQSIEKYANPLTCVGCGGVCLREGNIIAWPYFVETANATDHTKRTTSCKRN